MKIEYFNSDRKHEMIKFVAEMLKVEALAVEQAIDAFEAEYPESLGFSISDIFDQNERNPDRYPLSRANPAHIDIARAAVIAIGSDFELHDSDWFKVDEAIDDACREAGLVKENHDDADDDDDIDEDDDDFDDDDLLEDEDEDDDDDWGAADDDDEDNED